jgi:hypothetical protein
LAWNVTEPLHGYDQKCVDYAWECIRLAGLADDPEIRDRLMDMARSWLAVAERTHPVDERSLSVIRVFETASSAD